MNNTVKIDRGLPGQRPVERVIGYQKWRDLLFVHWTVSSETLRPLIPAGLELDLFDGKAWLGLVPFAMRGVRPWWGPSVPFVSNFLETNVRTYVLLNGEPGVWFFSLDAANSLAVRIARSRWALPYFRAQMSLQQTSGGIRYSGQRLWPEPSDASYTISAELSPDQPKPAEIGTLEHFLVERYLLFAVHRSGEIYRGQVHHTPYEIQPATVMQCEENLSVAAGLPPCKEIAHACFSSGVDVEIFPLRAQKYSSRGR
ncbi:YqjF family protein [Thalassoroseus pseudoceratinae]|uniref:YqjF family protein n=1 Tax=Thalassoroseus pseudoceratinae TaxID=2713176 RepID=UPI001421683D|nr:DUF2071 domain-containing protein [Thalassoroseus pseudoceratinae]